MSYVLKIAAEALNRHKVAGDMQAAGQLLCNHSAALPTTCLVLIICTLSTHALQLANRSRKNLPRRKTCRLAHSTAYSLQE